MQLKTNPNVEFEGMSYNMKLNQGFLFYQAGKLE